MGPLQYTVTSSFNKTIFNPNKYHMKKIFTLSLLMLFLKVALAQITVTISVVDNYSWSPLSGATVTLPGANAQTSVVTDASGKAVFTLSAPAEAGYQSFTITAPGYLNYSNDYLWIDPASATVNKTAPIKKAYTINLKVTDQADVNIENAAVSMSYPDSTRYTDANGEVSFEAIYSNGSYTYSVSAAGYADSTASVYISGSAASPYVIPTIKLNRAYDVVFTVTNGTKAISGATITLGGTQATTDENGQATFKSKINGTYSYLITKSGYIDVTGSVTVSDADATPVITLNSGVDLTFRIINGASGETGLQKDTITINGLTKITDQTGLLTFGVEAGSNFAFTNKKAGFTSVPVNIENLQKDTTVTIYMKPEYQVSFYVYNGIDYTMMEGATVTFNGTEIVTGADGLASYTSLEPSSTPYDYTITGPEGSGFTVQTGTVSLPLASTDYLYDNNRISKSVYLSKPYAYIALTSGWMSYFGAATITFNGVDYNYDAGLGGNSFYVDPGTYSYTITPANDTKAIVSGTVTVTETNPGVAYVNVVDGKKIEMYVTDGGEDQQGIEGASVTLDGETKTTDADGYVLYERKAVNTNYPYAVVKDGFATVEGTANLVTADLLLNVKMNVAYNVTFVVINGPSGDVALANDTITIGDKTLVTGADGKATFQVNKGDNISFVNKKTGFVDVPVEMTGIDSDKYHWIYMVPSYTVAIQVLDVNTYNPISEASVVFNGKETTTNMDGYAYFYSVEPSESAYTYTVTGAGSYGSANGEITLPFTSTEDLLATNNTASIIATLSSPGVFVALIDGMLSYFGAATITFDGVDYAYDAGLGATTINCSLGTHTFVITPSNQSKAIIKGTVDVKTAEIVYLPINVVAGWSVEIYAVNSSQDPIEGATITFDGTEATTDATGLAKFNRIPDGTYNYSVSKANYNGVDAASLDINKSDVTKVVTLTHGSTVTFHVGNNGKNVEGVTISFNGVTVVSGADGNAVFTEVDPGSYTYSATKSGYDVLSGDLTVSDSNLTRNIEVVVTGINLASEYSFKVYPNPTHGSVYVVLPKTSNNGITKLSVTNATGAVIFERTVDMQSSQIQIDLSKYTNGMYFIRIGDGTNVNTFKVIKN